MIRHAVTAAAMLVIFGCATTRAQPAAQYTAETLEKTCSAAAGTPDNAACLVWLHGFYDGFSIGRAEASGELAAATRAKACPPADIDAPKSMAALHKYLDGHKWTKDAHPGIALHLALVDAYPCP